MSGDARTCRNGCGPDEACDRCAVAPQPDPLATARRELAEARTRIDALENERDEARMQRTLAVRRRSDEEQDRIDAEAERDEARRERDAALFSASEMGASRQRYIDVNEAKIAGYSAALTAAEADAATERAAREKAEAALAAYQRAGAESMSEEELAEVEQHSRPRPSQSWEYRLSKGRYAENLRQGGVGYAWMHGKKARRLVQAVRSERHARAEAEGALATALDDLRNVSATLRKSDEEAAAADHALTAMHRRAQRAESIIARAGIVESRPQGAAGRSLGRALANYAAATWERRAARWKALARRLFEQRAHLRVCQDEQRRTILGAERARAEAEAGAAGLALAAQAAIEGHDFAAVHPCICADCGDDECTSCDVYCGGIARLRAALSSTAGTAAARELEAGRALAEAVRARRAVPAAYAAALKRGDSIEEIVRISDDGDALLDAEGEKLAAFDAARAGKEPT